MTEFSEFWTAFQNGGNAALIAAVWFIIKAETRLARIEKALENYMRADDGKRDD